MKLEVSKKCLFKNKIYDIDKKINDVLEIVNLSMPHDRKVGSLSGGQRQTIAIARSLIGQPKVVLLDEPTAALGVAQKVEVLKLIRRLADRGIGVVVISHNISEVLEVSDRVVVLRLGKVVANFETKDITSDDVVAAITGSKSFG